MTSWLPPLIAAAAIAATYLFCIRPHLRGRSCGMNTATNAGSTEAGSADAEVARQVAELREELRVLRAQDALETGRVPGGKPNPPTDG
jgi:hypothetical protein